MPIESFVTTLIDEPFFWWHEHSWHLLGATDVNLHPHQILRLPRKMTTQNLTEICWKQLKRHLQCAADPSMIRAWNRAATRRATEVTFRARHIEKYNILCSGYLSKFTKHCPCHEKWHLNFTKYRACHQKWHLSFTKYCACHKKWHLNFTKYCACHEKWSFFLLLDDPITWLYYYLTIPITWLYYLTTPITWLYYYLTIPITWVYYYLTLLLLDDSYYLTIPITWRSLLLDDSYYLTIPITRIFYYLTIPISSRLLLLDDPYYLTTPTTWRFLLLDSTITWLYFYLTIPITWRFLLLDDPYYLTTPTTWRFLLLDDPYYLTTPTTWRFLLLESSITWRFLLLDCAMSFVYRKFLINLNFLRIAVSKNYHNTIIPALPSEFPKFQCVNPQIACPVSEENSPSSWGSDGSHRRGTKTKHTKGHGCKVIG